MATKLSLLFVLALFISSQSANAKVKTTSFTVFFQDWSMGTNATVLTITGIPGRLWNFFSFGTTFCTDDPITIAQDGSSLEVARAQGIYVTSALDGSYTHVLISIIFTNGQYKGSTLEVQGASAQEADVREVSVVGGTGRFRYAKGYATLETVYLDEPIGYAVLRFNATVKHYYDDILESM